MSSTTATLQACPARLVPGAAGQHRRVVLGADRHGRHDVVVVAREDHAERDLAVVGGVGGVDGPGAGVEVDLPAQASGKGGAQRAPGRLVQVAAVDAGARLDGVCRGHESETMGHGGPRGSGHSRGPAGGVLGAGRRPGPRRLLDV